MLRIMMCSFRQTTKTIDTHHFTPYKRLFLCYFLIFKFSEKSIDCAKPGIFLITIFKANAYVLKSCGFSFSNI